MFQRFHKWINGAPNGYITLALIVVGIVAILIALLAPAEVKAIALAWLVLP